jgi:SAM-dependent methyltransferase
MVSPKPPKTAAGLARQRELLEREPAKISTEISPEDGMYVEGHGDHYFHVGRSALRGIRLAMLAAGKDDCHDILDMGCGYGRVLRTLQAAFPRARLTAADLVRDAVDYCARAFGAKAVYSRERPEQIRIDGTFDLVWCGTMLTNLNADRWRGFLNLFHSLLSPGGLLVFTTHGRYVADRLREGAESYGLEEEVIRKLLADYDREGFGYGDYPPHVLEIAHIDSDYGISVSSPAWICARLAELPDLRIVHLQERGWDNHQDIIACFRPAE